jgi:two-component system phosphate regulon sensor histidine kinase PhoR
LQFGLLYLVLWFLLLLGADLLIGTALREARPGAGSNVRLILWTGGSVLLALSAVSVWLYVRHLSWRVRQLEQFSLRMAEQDFRSLPKDERADELAGLAQALGDVATQYDRTIRLLAEERERSATILRSMVEGVAVIEPKQKIAFCNDAFCQALGLKGLPCAGRLLVEVTRQSGLLELVQQALDTRRTVSGETEMGTTPPRVFSMTAAPLTGANTGVVLVLHDITELRKLERMRRDFVANVSHEFKTPLTAIQGFAETLLGGALEDAKNSHRFLEIIRDHAVRLSRVTDDLLKLSSIEAGKLELQMRPVAVAELVQACLETERIKAEQRQLGLAAECPKGLPLLQGDPARLREALLNLLDNAIQYTPRGGKVMVRASASNGQVTIAVSDTGIGIPKKEQQRIFERFYRVDDARSREVGGTGLGLSITRHLVEAHGGRIEVASEIGRGSTFSLIFPNLTPDPAT